MEVFSSNIKMVLWVVVYDNVVEEETYHDEIGPLGLGFNFFGEDKKGAGREGSSDFLYLLMLIIICTEY